MNAGVLLVNLGTPDAPTPAAIRRYLAEFLWDRRVVSLPRALWWPVLHGFILPFRPQRLAEKYRLIWTAEGSPLLAICRRQAQALAQELGSGVPVRLAMRYGVPAIAEAIAELDRAQVRRLVVLPLYPQYSRTTTASVTDALADALRRLPQPPELRVIEQYGSRRDYIDALADSVRGHWTRHGRGDHLLMSFHGIPEQYVAAGDPYAQQCHETGRLLAQALALAPGDWSLAFQSRLGRAPWLKPYTDHELPRLARRGVRTLDAICPGFSADCLETLEEVAIRYAEDFRKAGGGALRYIAALNDSPAHIRVLAALVAANLKDVAPDD